MELIVFIALTFFGGFATHNIEKESLYRQCYDQNYNLDVEKCSHKDVQKAVRK